MDNEKQELVKQFENYDKETLKIVLNFTKNLAEQRQKQGLIKEDMEPIPSPQQSTPEPPKTSFLDKALSATKSYVSRGFDNKKINHETKSLRVLSCHGNDRLQPCPHRMNSEKYPGSFFCGACGCGDKTATQLVEVSIGNDQKYSKLDFPSLNCPLSMPGFTNYEVSKDNDENTRKIYIESQFNKEYIMTKSKDTTGESENENSNNNETK